MHGRPDLLCRRRRQERGAERGREAAAEEHADADADGVFASFLDSVELAEDRERRPVVRRSDRESSKAFRTSSKICWMRSAIAQPWSG
jgi:hypothetical protein